MALSPLCSQRAIFPCSEDGSGQHRREALTQVWLSSRRAFQALLTGRDSRHLLHAAHSESDEAGVPLQNCGSVTRGPLEVTSGSSGRRVLQKRAAECDSR